LLARGYQVLKQQVTGTFYFSDWDYNECTEILTIRESASRAHFSDWDYNECTEILTIRESASRAHFSDWDYNECTEMTICESALSFLFNSQSHAELPIQIFSIPLYVYGVVSLDDIMDNR